MSAPRAHERKRVLVIDDEPNVLRVMESVLVGAGHAVTCVERGGDALRVVGAVRSQLVFLDTHLLDVSSAELCRALVAHKAGPVVALAPRGEVIGVEWSRDGVIARLSKPFTPQSLLELVAPLLTNGGKTRRDLNEPSAASAHLASLRLDDASRPSLSGDMADVPVADILQSLVQQRQTGILAAQRDHVRIAMAFEHGVLRMVLGENTGRDFLLGNILVSERLLSPHDLSLVLQNRAGSRRALGQQLVRLGYVTSQDIEQALRRQSSELVYELLSWQGGRFAFHRRETLPPELIEHDLGVRMEQLLMEGFRRVDEWAVIKTVLPSLEVVLVQGTTPPGRGATDEERAVYARVDGRRRARDIIEEMGGSAFSVASAMQRLLSAGVVAPRPQLGRKQ